MPKKDKTMNMHMNMNDVSLLFVEDDERFRESMRTLFESLGIRFQVCESAEQGLAAVKQNCFDMVISDLQLPGMDGLTFLNQIGKYQPQTRKYLLTAYGTEETETKAYQQGINAFMTKPLSPEEFKETLHRFQKTRWNGWGH